MNDKQIIKDLAEWVEYGDDDGYLLFEILDLINRLTEEVRLLKEENDQLSSENEWLRAYLNQPIKLQQALKEYMDSQNPKWEEIDNDNN